MKLASCAAAGQVAAAESRMLLLDGNTQEVYEVDDSLVSIGQNHEPARITLSEFETLACKPEMQTRIGRLLKMHARGPVSLKLCNSGVAWAMRFAVVHNGELPIPEREFGSEFLVLWPPSTSIHAFFELQEAARRATGITGPIPALPRPTFSFRPVQSVLGPSDVRTARRVDVRELTVAQRLFAASMSTHATPFPQRHPTDTWATRMERTDSFEFKQLQDRRRRTLGGAAAAAPASPPPNPEPEPGAMDAAASCVVLDLPDEMLGLIAAQRLRETMQSAKTVHETTYVLMRVSRAFRRAAVGAVRDVQLRVHAACASLLGASPMPPARVQAALEASGLTLRAALGFGTCPVWYEYVRARYAAELARRPVVVRV